MPKTEPGRCVRYLGRMTLHAPGDGARTDELVDLGPKFVLLASRNLRFTGNRKMAETLFPRLRAVMNHIAKMSPQDDGLPRQSGFSTMYDDWATDGVNSYTSGLWIAAMRAYAALAAHLGDAAEAERYRALAARAVERFEALLWNEEQGYYMFCAPGTGARRAPCGLAPGMSHGATGLRMVRAVAGPGSLLPPAGCPRRGDDTTAERAEILSRAPRCRTAIRAKTLPERAWSRRRSRAGRGSCWLILPACCFFS